jgi:hypothetical protein
MAKTYEPIATTVLGSTATSIIFSSIPQSYTDLRIVWSRYQSQNGNSWIQLNGDTGTNYGLSCLSTNGGTVYATSLVSANRIGPSVFSAPSNTNPFSIIDIFSYTGTTNKIALSTVSGDQNGSGWIERVAGVWRNSAAVTSVSLNFNGGTIPVGATATLYGIKAA